MFTRALIGRTLAALAGVAMLGATATSASAFTLSAPSLDQSVATSHVERVYYYHGGGYHGGYHRYGYHGGYHGYGYHGGAVVAPMAGCRWVIVNGVSVRRCY